MTENIIKNQANKISNLIIILIFSTIIILALFFTTIFISVDRNILSTRLENNYKNSYYNFIENLRDVEVDLSKVVATNSTKTQKILLNLIYQNCNLAVNNLTTLPISNNNTDKINTSLNTIGGFSYSLLNKLQQNKFLSSEDFSNLSIFHGISENLLYIANNYLNEQNYNYNITNQVNFKNGNNSNFSAGFSNLVTDQIEIPTLIFDGPFSDGVINQEIKGLSQNIKSSDEVYEKITNLLEYYTNYEILYKGETLGKFETYNFEVFSDSTNLYIQITKRDGFLLNITSFGGGGEVKFSNEECMEIAVETAKNFGFENIFAVWGMSNENIVYVNLAPIINGVIYYPDLIKVKVDNASGLIIGWEAKNYAYNHVNRSAFNFEIDIISAQNLLSPLLTVRERNFCLIPDDYGNENFAYEFICTWNDYVYYVYLDSVTGEELDIMRIVDTDYGELFI